MQKYRFNLLFAACFGAAIVLVSWFLTLPRFSTYHGLQIFIVLAQIGPLYLSDLLTGNTHEGGAGVMFVFWLLAFVQWFIAGYFLSLLVRMMRRAK